MDIAGIRSAADFDTTAKATTQTAKEGSDGGFNELGQTQFLELFIAQLNNQNPLDPAKNEEFIAQLAQFSSVEGIQKLNESVDSMAASMQSSLTLDAASLVGRGVMVASGQAAYLGEPVAGRITLTEPTSNLTVDITRPTGELVRRVELGPMDQGGTRFVWDGTDANGNPAGGGNYHFRAFSEVGGYQREFGVEMPDRVVSVSLSEKGIIANLAGGGAIPAAQIKEIQ